MKALYTTKPGDFRLVELPRPVAAAGEVLVRVESIAICHTDLNIKNGLSPAVRYPCVPGHEIAGVIEACGVGVNGLVPGDFGALQTIIGCGGCEPCRLGLTNNCENFDELGLRRNGGFAEYTTIPARNFVRMPVQVDSDQACLCEPLANAVAAVRRAAPGLTESAVVIGPGPIGLLVLAMLRLHGLQNLTLVGTRDYRLALGRTFGAENLVNVRDCDPLQTVRHDLLHGRGAGIVIDCSGTIAGFRLALDLVARFGRVICEGLVPANDTMPFSPGQLPGNASIIGVEGWLPSDFQIAANLIINGQIDTKPLITHRFLLEDWEEAFEMAENRHDDMIKAIIKPSTVKGESYE